jgi:hypothetical protein
MNDKIAIPDTFQSIERFQEFLNKTPENSAIKTNKMADNSKYLPIGYLENTLDEMFAGLWQTENFRWTVVANEVCGALDLCIFHPVAKTWLKRTGSASVMIQMKSVEKGGTGDITNIADKIKNTLTKDFPHLKAECLKNACKSLGVLFGRNLNRDEYDFTPLSEQMDGFDEVAVDCIALLDTAKLDAATKKAIRASIDGAGAKKLDGIMKYLKGKQ